ncbi:hypothetical protein SOPP22_10890 [Shewanella sp. OPT22]|nr:hypothetical protein SOPP22_10890 [Shewanella sp. OPT22]
MILFYSNNNTQSVVSVWSCQSKSLLTQQYRIKRREYASVEAEIFIGRMVQHILPKEFQRLRLYGLKATASFKKWYKSSLN